MEIVEDLMEIWLNEVCDKVLAFQTEYALGSL